MADNNFKEVYGARHFFGLLLALLIPTMPTSLSLLSYFMG